MFSDSIAYALHEDDAWGFATKISIVDFRESSAPRLLSTIEGHGKLTGLDVSDGKLFVSSWRDGLLVFDVQDPMHPLIFGQLRLPGLTRDVAVEGDRAFLAAYSGWVDVIDVSEAQAPGFLHRVFTTDDLWKVNVSEEIVFATSSNSVFVIEARGGKRPRVVNVQRLSRVRNTAPSGDTLFVADWYGLTALDVSSPPETSRGAQCLVGENGAKAVAIQGAFAYVGSDEGLAIYDISSPVSPKPDRQVDTGASYDLLAFDDGVLVVGEGPYGRLLLLDARPGSALETLSTSQPGTYLRGIAVDEGYVYLADAYQGLVVVDIRDPVKPELLFRGSEELGRRMYAIAVSGDYAFVLTPREMRVIDVSDRRNPRLVSASPAVDFASLVYNAGYVHAAKRNTILTYDVRDPSNSLVSVFTKPDHAQIQNLAVAEGRLFAYSWNYRAFFDVDVFRVSESGALVQSDRVSLGRKGCLRSLHAEEDLLFAGISGNVVVYDTSDPADLRVATSHAVPWRWGCPRGYALSPTLLFLAMGGDGLKAYKRHPPLTDQQWFTKNMAGVTVPAGYPPGPYRVRFSHLDGYPGASGNHLRVCSRRFLNGELSPILAPQGDQVSTPLTWSLDVTGDGSVAGQKKRHRGFLLLPEETTTTEATYVARPTLETLTVAIDVFPGGAGAAVTVYARDEKYARESWASLVAEGGIPLPFQDDDSYSGFRLLVTDRAASLALPLAQHLVSPVRTFRYDLDGGLLQNAVARGPGADLTLQVSEAYEHSCKAVDTTSYRVRVTELCEALGAGDPHRAVLCP